MHDYARLCSPQMLGYALALAIVRAAANIAVGTLDPRDAGGLVWGTGGG